MLLNQDFKEFLQSLKKNKVKYLIVGGYAVAFHGHPRYTKNIDIWLSPDKENIAKLLKALDDFGVVFLLMGLQFVFHGYKSSDHITTVHV